MRVIKVQGKGRVTAQPDIVVLTFDVEEKAREYSECINNLNQRTAALRADIESVGRRQNELRTSNFSIRVDHKYKNGRHVFDGYLGSHTLHIELPAEKDLLNKVLGQIARGHSGAEVKLTFTVRDKEGIKQAALREAVRTAQNNARMLAEAASVKLGQIQEDNYGWTEIRVHDRHASMVCEAAPLPVAYEPDIEPEDVFAEDNVTLVYEIIE
jgi:uncharacterized protein YggE